MRWLFVPVFRGTLALLLASIIILSTVHSVSAYEIHIVKPDETLSQIAKRYGTTVAQLRQLNNLSNIDFVRYGQSLMINTDDAAPSSAENQVSEEFLPYKVQPGDSLTSIAQRYGVSLTQLATLNGISSTRWLYVGQVVLLPAPASEVIQPDRSQDLIPTDDAAPSSAENQVSEEFLPYRVQPGDSLTGIAQRYGVSLTQLATLNGISSTRWLYVGQVVLLPAPASEAMQPDRSQDLIPTDDAAPSSAEDQVSKKFLPYRVQPGDSLTSIAQRYGVSLTQIATLNGISPTRWLYSGQVVLLPNPTAQAVQPDRSQVLIHTVQPGEYLKLIAARYEVSAIAIVRENGLTSPNHLLVGQSLRIPPDSAEDPASSSYHTHNLAEYPTLTEKWIDVDLSEQRVVAYDGIEPVKAFIISSGRGNTPTVTGVFRIWAKVPMQDMQGGNRAAGNYYHLENVQNVQYFFTNYGFHGTYWHDNFGTPMSRGCINMSEQDAKWLFDWTSPTVSGDDWVLSDNANPGTLVLVHQ